MSLNRVCFIVGALAAILCAIAFFVRGGELRLTHGAICALVAWLALVDERQALHRERLDELEDKWSRRWEP